MKITYSDMYGRDREMSTTDAVEYVVSRAPALTEGQLESIQAEINELTKFVAKLTEAANLDAETLCRLLGYGFSVEP